MSPLSAKLSNSTLLVTGGTGSFGHAIVDLLLDTSIKEIRIFSRDEKKQDDMRKLYSSPKLKFYLGDVRNSSSLKIALRDVDYVFHAAALKQVPSCEFYPSEACQTNIIGTENVLLASIDSKVKHVVVLSTDKAVYPVNAMGISKAMAEKISIAISRMSSPTIINITRYGNVMFSRGSVIPLFISQLLSSAPISVTDLSMTRFMMTLPSAVELVLYAFNHGQNGQIFVQKSPAASLAVLVESLQNIFPESSSKVVPIGIRHGEKLYETLLSSEESYHAFEQDNYFIVQPDSRDLNYDNYYTNGQPLATIKEYSSSTTRQLTVEEMEELLRSTSFISDLLTSTDRPQKIV